METLSATYDDAADSFYKNNEQIIKNRENQQKLTDIMARVGDAFDRVRGALIEKFAPALEEIGNRVADFLEGFDVDAAVNAAERLVNGFVALLPVIAAVAAAVETFKTAMAISATIDKAVKAYKAFEAANKGASAAQWLLNAAMAANPIVLIVTLIAGLVAALVVLWTTNEDFRDAVTAAWQGVLDFISGVVDSLGKFFTETLPNAFNVVVDFFKNNWQNILLFLVNPFAGAFKLLYDNFEGFRNAVDTLLENIKNAFSNLATSIGETVGNIKDAIVNGIQNAIDFIVELPGRALEWGRDFIGGFVDGIRSMIDSVVDAVSSVADTVTSWLHFSRPDVGPLREYETWMPDMMQGLAKGIDGNIWRIRDSMANVAGVMADSLGATVTTGGNMAIHHSGTIRIEGVNNRGEFVAASNYAVEQALAGILRKQART